MTLPVWYLNRRYHRGGQLTNTADVGFTRDQHIRMRKSAIHADLRALCLNTLLATIDRW
jgi:hypothetical protein